MMKKLFLVFTILTMSIGIFLGIAENAFSQEQDAALVKIWPREKGKDTIMQPDPPSLTVKKGTIVLWMNGIPEQEIQISFQDGKTCRDVSVTPDKKHPGFFLNSKGCFVTSFLAYTNTTALQFPEKGNYTYIVTSFEGTVAGTGSITVVD